MRILYVVGQVVNSEIAYFSSASWSEGKRKKFGNQQIRFGSLQHCLISCCNSESDFRIYFIQLGKASPCSELKKIDQLVEKLKQLGKLIDVGSHPDFLNGKSEIIKLAKDYFSFSLCKTCKSEQLENDMCITACLQALVRFVKQKEQKASNSAPSAFHRLFAEERE